MSLYLYGSPGCGKSEFVKVLSGSLEELLRAHADPLITVNVVKVQLNALKESDLHAIANVRGISDMSIERLCEQSIAKGHVAILHLEENPQDPKLQQELWGVVDAIRKSLRKYYPDRVGNIIPIVTSNYIAADTLQMGAVVRLQAPAVETQQEWCCRMLEETVRSGLGARSVCLDREGRALMPTGDMRALRKWWLSLSFHLIEAAKVISDPSDVQVSVQPGDGEGNLDAVVACNSESAILHLGSSELCVVYPKHLAADSAFSSSGLLLDQESRILSLIAMLRAEYLQPAVLVVTGAQDLRELYISRVMTCLRNELSGEIRKTEVTLETEDDKEKVVGKPGDIQGGLFKFINETNAETLEDQTKFAVVTANVNTTGQFILRELLESGRSSTHRLGIQKKRVLFIVSTADQLQSPLYSRAHDIFDLTTKNL